MKLIRPSVEIIPQESGIEGIKKAVELAARNCYKSESYIKEGSADKMLTVLEERKHFSPFEHGTVYLSFNRDQYITSRKEEYLPNFPFSRMKFLDDDTCLVTTNYRAIKEHRQEWMLKEYLCEPTPLHEKRIMVRFICDRGIMAEFTRHRVFSFCIESSRYNNYSKDKFGNELTFIRPCWFGENQEADDAFYVALSKMETTYFNLLKQGWRPEQARNVLPMALKTDVIMTGFESDWDKFFELRCSPQAHPQARELAEELQRKIKNYGIK